MIATDDSPRHAEEVATVMKERIGPIPPKVTDILRYLIPGLSLLAIGLAISLSLYPNNTFLLGILISFFGTPLIYAGLTTLNSHLTWHRNPNAFSLDASSQAAILDRQEAEWEDDYGKKWHSYWVIFQFDTNQGPVTLRARVSQPFYHSIDPDTAIAVRYNATNPCIALLEGEYGFG